MADLAVLTTADAATATRFFAEVEPADLAAAVAAADLDLLAATLARAEVEAAAFTGILARLGEYAGSGHLVPLERILGVCHDLGSVETLALTSPLGRARPEDLGRLMASGFRGLVLAEVFRRMPDFVNPDRADRADLTVGFRLLGHPSGEVERYVVRVCRGALDVDTDPAEGGRRDATVTCEAHDFLRLVTGQLSPVVGVLKGRLKVRGDRAKALQLAGVFDIPQPD